MKSFSPERARIVREQLVAHVTERPRRRRRLLAAGLVLAGAVAGAGASAGAFALTGTLSIAQPSGGPAPDLPDAVPAPPGVIPGAPIISLVGTAESRAFSGPIEIDLRGRPAAATHARVTLTPTSPGRVGFGTDAAGNNPSVTWSAADLADPERATTWDDLPLDETATTLYLSPAGATGVVTVQYVTRVPTALGVNDDGQTFGVSGTTQGEPDLVAVSAEADDGRTVVGYAYASDLAAFSPDHSGQPANPDEALAWQREREEAYPNGWDIPVYESDGTTRIGTHHLQN